MSTDHYRRLLVTTDFSDSALAGVREAARLAGQLDAEIVLLTVVHDDQPYMMLGSALHWGELVAQHEDEARVKLEQYATEHLAGARVKTLAVCGNPAAAIARAAKEESADLIVMCSRGHGFLSRIALGSTTQRVLERAPCPVLVVRPPE